MDITISYQDIEKVSPEELFAYGSDPLVKQYTGWPLMKTLKDAEDYLALLTARTKENTHLYYGIVDEARGLHIGMAMFFNFNYEANHAEMGYVLHRNYWGKGLGTKLVEDMVNYAFQERLLRKLFATVISPNHASIKVLTKNGFEPEGRLKDFHYLEGRYCDEIIFGRLRSDAL